MISKLGVVLLLSTLAFGQMHAKVNMPKAGSGQGPTVSLTCNPPTQGVTPNSYNFYFSLVSGGPYTLVGNSATCAYTDTSEAFGTVVYYVAASVNSATCPQGQTCVSGYSNQTMAQIPQNPVPQAPSNLTVGSIVAGKVDLEWQAPAKVKGYTLAGYTVWRGGQPGMQNPKQVAVVTNKKYTDKPGIGVFYYQITATDTWQGEKIVTQPSNVAEAIVK